MLVYHENIVCVLAGRGAEGEREGRGRKEGKGAGREGEGPAPVTHGYSRAECSQYSSRWQNLWKPKLWIIHIRFSQAWPNRLAQSCPIGVNAQCSLPAGNAALFLLLRLEMGQRAKCLSL